MPPITDPNMLQTIVAQQGLAPNSPPANPNAGLPSINPQPFPGALPPLHAPVTQQRTQQVISQSAEDHPVALATAKSDEELKRLQLRKERIAQGLDPDTGKPSPNAGKIGEAALDGMSDADKNIVRSIVQGRGPNISAYAIAKNPQLMRYVQAAYQLDPGTDLTTFQRRQVAAQKFLSNPNSPMLRVNQALQHLGRFYNTAHALDNFHSGLFGAIGNYARAGEMAATHDPKYTAFATDRDALATELAAAFQGANGGALADREHWRDVLSAPQSPESFDKAIQEAAGLLGGRIEASTAQFQQAVGANADKFDLMSPEARKAFEQFTAPDFGQPVENKDNRELATERKPISLPNGYSTDHEQFLEAHKGTLTVPEYIAFRKQLDEKYSTGDKPLRSDLDEQKVKEFVDGFNQTHKASSIPVDTLPMSELEKSATSPGGVAVRDFANAATLGLPELVGGQEGRDALHMANEDHPVAAAVGDIAGSIVPIGMAENAFLKGGLKLGKDLGATSRGRFLADAMANSSYQGARGFNDADEGDGLGGFVRGAASGAGGAAAGNAIARGVTPILSEGTQDALKALKGTDLTTLQRMGLGKGEEVLRAVPFSRGAQAKAIESWNVNNVNRALSFVPDSVKAVVRKVPKSVRAGTDSTDFLNQQLNNGYNEIKPKVVGSVDKSFGNAMAALKASVKSSPDKRKMFNEVQNAVDIFVKSGKYDGNSYQAASERLRALMQDFGSQAENQGSTAARDMVKVTEQARQQIRALVARNDPAVGKQLKGLERAWASKMRIEDATNRALSNGGVYAPDQKLASIKKLDTSGNKGMTARGKGLDQKETRAAQDVMGGQTVPKHSNLYTTGAAIGVTGASGFATPVIPAAIGATAAAVYMPALKRITQAITTGARPSTSDSALVRKLLAKVGRNPNTIDDAALRGLEDALAQRMRGDLPEKGNK